MSVLNQSGDEQIECPLCMEPFEVDDLNFFPCTCGYQICRFCWHRIRTDENGLCPACRKAYPEDPADFKPLSKEDVVRIKAAKRQKNQQKKQKITENRKSLENVRVVQRNLVFVLGLPARLADAEVLRKHEYFGKFGKILKVVINQSSSYAGTQTLCASAYVTYSRSDDALRAIQAVNNISVDGRVLKSSLGTTKYCSHFMKNQPCMKTDCMYLHEMGDPEASFTKEEMQQGKHQEFERKLHEQLIIAMQQQQQQLQQSAQQMNSRPTPSPPSVQFSNGSILVENNNSGSSSSRNSPYSNPAMQSSGFGELSARITKEIENVAHSNNNSSSSKHKSKQNRKKGRKHKGEKNTHSAEDKEMLDKLPADSRHTKTLEHNNYDNSDTGSTSSRSSSNRSADDQQLHTEDPSMVVITPESSVPTSSNSPVESANEPNMLYDNDVDTEANSIFSSEYTDCPESLVQANEWLTHLPDVLPPVHTSEDWQAAFGFGPDTDDNNLSFHHMCDIFGTMNEWISCSILEKEDSKNSRILKPTNLSADPFIHCTEDVTHMMKT